MLKYCREKGGRHAERGHLQLLEECAIACEDLAESLKRQPEVDGDKSLACADICERCAESCEQFEDDAQMQECAESCRECAAACLRMSSQ